MAVGSGPGATPIRKRLVLHFPGFEPLLPGAHLRRFMREARKTAPHYGMQVDFSAPELGSEAGLPVARLTARAGGEGWNTESEIVVYGLGAMPKAYGSRKAFVRLFGGLAATAALVLNGTAYRYFRVSWRYGLFFLYPAVFLLTSLLASVLAGRLIGWAAGPVAGSVVAPVLFSIVVAALMFRTHMLLALDLVSAGSDIARGRRPDIDAVRAAAVADAVRRIAASDHDEIVCCAHSFGAVAAVETLSRVDDGISRRPGLLAAGSTLLQVGLHPAADWVREATSGVVERGYPWLEAQSLTDPINFYRSDPARELAGASNTQQTVVHVRFRDQLSAATYRAIKLDFFRVHRQFVFGVERRSHYSWHAILCGPEPFDNVAGRPGLAPEWRFGEDGR